MTPAVVLATAGRRSGLQLSLTDVAGEGIHVRADGVQLVGSRIRDGRPARVAGLAHVDAVQLIPPAAGVARGWYAGSVLRAVVVADCTVLAPGARLQGMTGFDGAFVDLRITGNAVWSAAAHLIHVNGWLSGECRDNRDQHGAVIRVTLYPVRIGGGPGLSGQQVWVIGFAAQSPVQYGTVVGDIARDLRQQRWNDRDVFLADFDYEGFRAAAALLPGGPEAEVHAEQLKQLAVAHGRRVGAEQQHEDHEMTMGNDVLQGMLRHVLTTVGGLAVGYGWLTAANLEMLVGLVMAMAGFVWSYYNKQQVGSAMARPVEAGIRDNRASVPIAQAAPGYPSDAKAALVRDNKLSKPPEPATEWQKGFFLSERSWGNLQGVYPELVQVITQGIAASPHDFTVIEGVRSPERQRALFEGDPKRTQTLNSKHIVQSDGYAHAVDLAIIRDGKLVDDLAEYAALNRHLQQVAQALGINGLVWGGSWAMRDGMHWEL